MQQRSGQNAHLNTQEQLFLGVSEQLAEPLLQIARLSELARSARPKQQAAYWQLAEAIASASLQLTESYALSLRLQGKITPLVLEPVTVSSLLYDTAQRLDAYAKQYGVALELDPSPRVQPVLADRTVLEAAMVSLGQLFVQSQAGADEHPAVVLGAHRSRYGVVAGLYGASRQLNIDSLRRAHALQGQARAPLPQLATGPAAGVFVAESLLSTLSARLHVARYRKMSGLATTLTPSRQLQLV